MSSEETRFAQPFPVQDSNPQTILIPAFDVLLSPKSLFLERTPNSRHLSDVGRCNNSMTGPRVWNNIMKRDDTPSPDQWRKRAEVICHTRQGVIPIDEKEVEL